MSNHVIEKFFKHCFYGKRKSKFFASKTYKLCFCLIYNHVLVYEMNFPSDMSRMETP